MLRSTSCAFLFDIVNMNYNGNMLTVKTMAIGSSNTN